MHFTRREILRLGLGSSTLLACGATVPMFLARSASALQEKPAGAPKGRILVVLQLDGGNDGLNTVVPYCDDDYRRRRPRLQIAAKDVQKMDDHVGLHPALDGFGKLLEKQRLAMVQSVGYPNPNRSHLESMTIWQTARLTSDAATAGWLASALDRRRTALGGDAPGLHVDEQFPLPRSLQGGEQLVPSLTKLEQFRRRLGISDERSAAEQRVLLDQLSLHERGEPGSLLQFVERCSLMTYASSARLESLVKGTQSDAKYPEFYGLARRLRLVAQLIKAGLTTTIYYVHLNGFDTHANQLERHRALLQEMGASVGAFLDDLEGAGEADRVLMLIFSEFGRRLAENASGGTDHGTAAPVFLAGHGVKAGLHGPYPNLTDLEDGDPKHAIDFRCVYASVLDQWLQVPHRMVLGEGFEAMDVVRA
jgi:uncharacterized protein (DUF1501 family)